MTHCCRWLPYWRFAVQHLLNFLLMQRTNEFKGGKINYVVTGKGPAVVLLHGFAEDSAVWKKQSAVLKDTHTVITPDLPGSGASNEAHNLSMEFIAESVKAVLDWEHITTCCMIGHSMGGYVTLAFAEIFPDLLNSFGLFHSTAFSDSEEKINTRRKGIEFMNEQGAEAFLKSSIPGLFSSCSKEAATLLIEKHIERVSYFRKQPLIAYYEAMIRRPDRSSLLKQNNLPILFVLGRYDNAVPLEQGLRHAHLPDVSFVHILEKSAHMGMLEEPDETNAILKNFLLKTV
jgi:pimeloyl-ACP methyl ester carboxylesterase